MPVNANGVSLATGIDMLFLIFAIETVSSSVYPPS